MSLLFEFMCIEQVGNSSRMVIVSPPMRKPKRTKLSKPKLPPPPPPPSPDEPLSTAQMIREFLIREFESGHLSRPKLAVKLDIKSSMMSQIISRQRDWAMHHLDATAEFYRMLPEEFIAHVRKEIRPLQQPQETQRDTNGHTSSFSTAGDRFRHAR